MSMNVNTAAAAVYGSYQNSYRTGSTEKKKEAAKTDESSRTEKKAVETVGEKSLSEAAKKLLKELRGSRSDMDFMVADYNHGDKAEDILDQSDKEYTVIFSNEEIEKMASDPKYYAEKMDSVDTVVHMSDKIFAQLGIEHVSGKTDGLSSDLKMTKFGISFNSDGSTTFFAQLEKASTSQKEYIEKLQEKKADDKKAASKDRQTKPLEVKKTTIQADSEEDLLEKIKNIDWDSVKAENSEVGSRFDLSV